MEHFEVSVPGGAYLRNATDVALMWFLVFSTVQAEWLGYGDIILHFKY